MSPRLGQADRSYPIAARMPRRSTGASPTSRLDKPAPEHLTRALYPGRGQAPPPGSTPTAGRPSAQVTVAGWELGRTSPNWEALVKLVQVLGQGLVREPQM